MKLYTINTGFFKLDGGAMHGVVPKSIWNNINPADENNMCTWAMRCMLVEVDNKLILIDNGIGNKQNAKFFSYYYLHGDASLEKSLNEAGFAREDITDMFLTHLHFDHCGGSIINSGNGGSLETNFPNATYWSQPDHWQWATKPNARERASFLKENILPIEESGQLSFVKEEGKLFTNISVQFVDGHTEKMMIPHMRYKGHTVVFMADLIPSAGHVPVPYVMAYDTRPLLTLTEKEKFLSEAVKNDYILFFEHDPKIECCTLQETEKGVRIKETFRLNEI